MQCSARTVQQNHPNFCMANTLKIFQLNAEKRKTVQESFMNDKQLKEFSALAISEP